MAADTTNRTQEPAGNRFLITWALLTALVGAAMTIPASHGFYFFPMLLFVGLAVGIVQWVLLRARVPGAWRWIVASALGWVLALVMTGGTLYGIGWLSASRAQQLSVSLSLLVIKTLEVFVYTALFGILAAAQAIVLRSRGLHAGRWILMNIVGGTLLGVALQLVCGAVGVDLFSTWVLLSEQAAISSSFCVNIGLTIPRLQTNEPIFNWLPLSFAAQAVGWLVYSAASAWGIRYVISQ